jgi:hypothetical protein
VLRQEADQPLQGPEVAPNETHLQEAGMLRKEADQPFQGHEVTGTETYLQEAGVLCQEAGQPLQYPEMTGLRPTCKRLECSARRRQPFQGPEVAPYETYLQKAGVLRKEAPAVPGPRSGAQ